MAWTAPTTFVGNSTLTASQLNLYLRDNMLLQAPAKATGIGKYIVSTGPNSIAERAPSFDTVGLSSAETCSSSSYSNLSTVGPTVTVATGQYAMLMWSAEIRPSADTVVGRMTVDVTGATTNAGTDTRSLSADLTTGNVQIGLAVWYDGLNPGTNTFTCKYKVAGTGTADFAYRRLVVLPY